MTLSSLISPLASLLRLSYIALIFVAIIIIKYTFFTNRRPPGTKPLPGPGGIPFIGRVHDVDPNQIWYKMKEFSDRYNGFFRTVAMGDTHLWISDQKIIHDLLAKRAQNYSSRPAVPAVPGSDTGGEYLPLLAYDDHWRKQKKFAHTVLSTAHGTGYFDYTALEAKRLLAGLAQDPKDYYNLLDLYCGRIASRLAYGHPDSAPAHCRNAREFIPHISPSGPITNLLPVLGRLPEWLNPSIKDVRLRREREEKLWLGLMKDVEADIANGSAPVSYARTYFDRRAAEKSSLEKDNMLSAFGFEDREAAYAVGMLCTVSIFTISGPLSTFMLAMTLHQDWQDAARKEIDAVLGGRLAKLSDSPALPTLRAVIKECFRWKPPVPAGVPRLVAEDDVYNGYFVPKGTIVHGLEQAISRDPNLYPDPESYNPARWLEPSYPTFKEPLTEFPKLTGHHQFGVGRRACPGVDLAEAELLVACCAILWGFTIKPKIGYDGKQILPSTGPESMTKNLIGGALKFDFDLKVRQDIKGRREMIMHMAEEDD